MGLMDNIGSRLIHGVAGNLSELTPEKLMQDYGAYLMTDEKIIAGFILVRNVVIFTDKRIIDFDKQGATGQKTCVKTIYIDSIIRVSCETAGFGIDDSQINIEYITSPYFRSNGGVATETRIFEFPRKYHIQELYRWLQEVAYLNHININK